MVKTLNNSDLIVTDIRKLAKTGTETEDLNWSQHQCLSFFRKGNTGTRSYPTVIHWLIFISQIGKNEDFK